MERNKKQTYSKKMFGPGIIFIFPHKKTELLDSSVQTINKVTLQILRCDF